MVKKYKVVRADRAAEKVDVGETVFDCIKHDYGCASEDTRYKNLEHISVTRDAGGDYPFFTIPKTDLEEIDAS